MKSKMAAGKAVEMGYRKVYWYKDGMKGWKECHNFLQSSDYSYHTRMLPKTIDAEELHNKIQTENSFVLVDIRDEKSKKKMGQIEGPTFETPLYRFHANYVKLPKNKLLILYDVNAKQAMSACRFLLNRNFPITKMVYLEGGMKAWLGKGLPVRTF